MPHTAAQLRFRGTPWRAARLGLARATQRTFIGRLIVGCEEGRQKRARLLPEGRNAVGELGAGRLACTVPSP